MKLVTALPTQHTPEQQCRVWHVLFWCFAVLLTSTPPVSDTKADRTTMQTHPYPEHFQHVSLFFTWCWLNLLPFTGGSDGDA